MPKRRYLDKTAPNIMTTPPKRSGAPQYNYRVTNQVDAVASTTRQTQRAISRKKKDTPAKRKEVDEAVARYREAERLARQGTIGPYREKTELDRAGGRLYAAAEQRAKAEAANEEAATMFGALFKPIAPSTYIDMYKAYKRGKISNVSDALAASYLTNSWSQQNPELAALSDVLGIFDVASAPSAIKSLRYAFPKVISSNRGLPNAITNNLMHNTIGRNKLALYAISPTNKYNTGLLLDKLNDITVQHISNGGLGPNTLGDFTPKLNRIRYITNDAENTLLHEGRHAIDRHGVPLTSEQERILGDAYGDDFVGLPFSPYARRSIKNYYGMGTERTTTNFDARRLLLGDNDKLSISKQNKILDNLDDSAIIYGVENANGYGGNYIEFLRKTGQLTEDKINAFRQAMKYVGGIAMPLGVGYGVYKNQ